MGFPNLSYIHKIKIGEDDNILAEQESTKDATKVAMNHKNSE